jgi:hypothetical protein
MVLSRAPDIDFVARPADLDALAEPDEASWREEREAVLLYR